MRFFSIPLLLVTAMLVAGCAGTSTSTTASNSSFACKNFASQPQAQEAWVAAGKPNASRVDSDGDGKACASLPANAPSSAPTSTTPSTSTTSSDKADCKTSPQPVVVEMSREKYPQSTLHIEVAVKDYQQPTVLHINRDDTDAHRDEWHKVINKGWDADGDGEVDDMDEYVFAMAAEGGRNANIALIKAADNRGSGSMLGSALRAYCAGQAFTIKPVGNRPATTSILVVADHGKRLERKVTAPAGDAPPA